MPELPEVQTVVNTLAPRLRGSKIRKTILRRDDIVTPTGTDVVRRLTGRTIQDIRRRAKRIVFDLDGDEEFYIHLGMTGRLTFADDPSVQPAKHTHLILQTTAGEVRFVDPRRFGGVFWANSTHDPTLGPEPLTLRLKELQQALGKTARPIKSALLDQRLIAGLGNIYVDESLFVAGIHPLALANQLSNVDVARLLKAIKKVLKKALRHRGSTLRDYVDAQGGKGAFQKLHNVYDRAEQPCRKCDEKIIRIVMGGRSTCFCPKCQPTT